jgi:hypothetical protein
MNEATHLFPIYVFTTCTGKTLPAFAVILQVFSLKYSLIRFYEAKNGNKLPVVIPIPCKYSRSCWITSVFSITLHIRHFKISVSFSNVHTNIGSLCAYVRV